MLTLKRGSLWSTWRKSPSMSNGLPQITQNAPDSIAHRVSHFRSSAGEEENKFPMLFQIKVGWTAVIDRGCEDASQREKASAFPFYETQPSIMFTCALSVAINDGVTQITLQTVTTNGLALNGCKGTALQPRAEPYSSASAVSQSKGNRTIACKCNCPLLKLVDSQASLHFNVNDIE